MTTTEEFKVFAKSMIDFVANYMDGITERRVLPDVEPGYLRPLVPKEAPEKPETWHDLMRDIDRVIMPGITHWHSPRFHAYFAIANSYPAIVADILSSGIGCLGFSWMASPACTELEMVMMDWLGQMLNLPQEFLFEGVCAGGKKSIGGGVIQGSASEATLIALLTARSKVVSEFHESNLQEDKYKIMSKLVAYGSSVAHSSVERAALLGGVKIRLLEPDSDNSLRGETLRKAMADDKTNGLIPFCVIATLGTTACCSFDNIMEIGRVCKEENVWLHIDAAYAGSAFICPEYRPILNGVEYADSFNFNPHKLLLVNFDCSAMWVKDRDAIEDAFQVNPLYLKQNKHGQMPEYRHWQIPLERRFRSLKLWFVLRLYGQEGLRDHIRNHVKMAHEFERLVEADDRFEITSPVVLGLVCFRLKGSNCLNKDLLDLINTRGIIHMSPSKIRQTYFLRFAVCAKSTCWDDVLFAWNEITSVAEKLLLDEKLGDNELKEEP